MRANLNAGQCGLSLAVGPGIPATGRRVYNHDGASRIPRGESFDAHAERTGAGTLEST